MNNTAWHESVTKAEINNFWGFGQNVVQYPSPLYAYILQEFLCSNLLRGTFKNFESTKPFSLILTKVDG